MTKKQFELREKANKAKYMDVDTEACVDAIMALCSRIEIVDGMQKLYRYRRLDKYELDGLENETIFMRWPSTYEDCGDCTPVLDLKEITDFIVRKNYPQFNPDILKRRLINYDEIKHNERFKKKIEDMRDTSLISCFTERCDNEKMWHQYADKNKGICIIYDLLEILSFIKEHNTAMEFMPIWYVEDREACAEIMLNHIDLLEDRYESLRKAQMTCMTKDKLKFSFEEEWRLIYYKKKTEMSTGKGEVIPFIKPWCILCGKDLDRTGSEYRELQRITQNKGIGLI